VGPARRAVLAVDGNAQGGDATLHLLAVANRPVILWVLDSLAEAGVRDVAVALEPALAPVVRSVLDAERPLPLEPSYLSSAPGEGLLEALARMDELPGDGPLLLHWGCGLFDQPLRSLLNRARVAALDSVVLIHRSSADAPVVELASERLASLIGHPRAGARGCVAGVALVGAAAPEVAAAIEPGRGADLDVLALVEEMARLGGRVRTLPVTGCWRHTGAADSGLDANRFVLSRLAVEPVRADSRGANVQGPVRVDASATIERSVVRGPAVIGAQARLYDAYIGPYTSLGVDVCIDGAEIENSIVLAGTRISHLDRRLEASVVGPDATICRDFQLPRAVRMHVGEGARISLA
jgi:glucose-1-phosphate thymidylyltransferase